MDLNAFQIDLFEAVKWVVPLNKDLFEQELNQINDGIFYGRVNSLVDRLWRG